MSKELIMEIDDNEYQKFVVWKLEQLYQSNGESTTEQIKEIKDTISNQLDKEQSRLDMTFDDLEDLVKHKRSVFKESVEFAVKKTLDYFPEHSGRTTRLIEVPGHGSFMVDLETGEFLGGKQYLYDDWVTGELKQPEPPEPRKINLKRSLALALPLVLTTGLIITTAITFVNKNFGALEITEYRYAKPGETGFKP
jgi:ElaB/YqjD/DUF883 family membrane-anchored ribosome-binding protein